MIGAIKENHELLALMGHGYRLRIPHDATPACLVHGVAQEFGLIANPSIELTLAQAEWLVNCGFLTKLTEHGKGQRLGWRAAGYDGDVADWWVCTQ